jgi:hypothetical protein
MIARRTRTSSRLTRPRPRRGIFVPEMLLGLFLIIAVATVTAVMLVRQQRVSQRLAETRAAQRVAESVLLDLQAGRPAQLPPEMTASQLDVQPVKDAALVGSSQWVRVEITHDGHRASLMGLVPAGATTQPAKGDAR